jgi:hypothetical protein
MKKVKRVAMNNNKGWQLRQRQKTKKLVDKLALEILFKTKQLLDNGTSLGK